MPDGTPRTTLVLHGMPSKDEWDETYRKLREQADLVKKKIFTSEDQQLIDFVEKETINIAKPRWENRLKQWKDKFPDSKYSTYKDASHFQTAYKRALKRSSDIS